MLLFVREQQAAPIGEKLEHDCLSLVYSVVYTSLMIPSENSRVSGGASSTNGKGYVASATTGVLRSVVTGATAYQAVDAENGDTTKVGHGRMKTMIELKNFRIIIFA